MDDKKKTSTATKTATSTKTSTEAYTQGNITVTGGAGDGDTKVYISPPGGSLANNSEKKFKGYGIQPKKNFSQRLSGAEENKKLKLFK